MEAECLVIMESDAAWPAWIAEDPALVVHERDAEETALDAALERVRRLGSQLESVVLVCGAASSASRHAARETLLRALAAAVDFHVPNGRLIVVSDGDFATRQAVAALVLEISEDLESAQSSASVRFRAQPRSSAPPRADSRAVA